MNQNTMPKVTDVKAWGELIVDAVNQGISEAGKLYKEYLSRGGNGRRLQATISLPTTKWTDLLESAEGKVYPPVMMYGDVHRAVKSLTAAEQKEIMVEGVEVVVKDTSIKWRPSVMSPSLRKQVFAPDHVRSLDEQKVWILEQERKTGIRVGTLQKANKPWDVVDGGLHIYPHEGVLVLTKGDIVNIVKLLLGKLVSWKR